MAHFGDPRLRELIEAPQAMRLAGYLYGIGIYEDAEFYDDVPTGFINSDWWRQIMDTVCVEPQPTNSEALKKLKTVIIKVEGKECSICITKFKEKEAVKSMPCKHLFHETCILTWLKKKSTCPYCRYQLVPQPM